MPGTTTFLYRGFIERLPDDDRYVQSRQMIPLLDLCRPCVASNSKGRDDEDLADLECVQHEVFYRGQGDMKSCPMMSLVQLVIANPRTKEKQPHSTHYATAHKT